MVDIEKCFLFLRLLFPNSNKVVHVILNSDWLID